MRFGSNYFKQVHCMQGMFCSRNSSHPHPLGFEIVIISKCTGLVYLFKNTLLIWMLTVLYPISDCTLWQFCCQSLLLATCGRSLRIDVYDSSSFSCLIKYKQKNFFLTIKCWNIWIGKYHVLLFYIYLLALLIDFFWLKV